MIEQAVRLLQQGELVAFPTETVYGLGGLATHPQAIQKLFAVKARSTQKPLSLLIPNKKQVVHWAKDISLAVTLLAEYFWPGPLTMLLKPTHQVLTEISAGSGRIGLRVPSHPLALALLSQLDNALAAPSANISGHLSSTTAESVRHQLGNKISLILEGDSCSVGIESTVIDMTTEPPVIRRLGAISVQAIERVLNQTVSVDIMRDSVEYCPGFVIQWVEHLSDGIPPPEMHSKTAILKRTKLDDRLLSKVTWIPMPSQPIFYKSYIYQTLHQLKQEGYRTILIERLPATQEWESITACLSRWCKTTD